MMPSLRARRRQMLYDEIVQAMNSLLAEKGYAAISMDELAARVGISKPTLYSHFPTKEDILIATIKENLNHVTSIINADQTPRTPLQQLSFILKTVVQMQIDKGALALRPLSPEILQVLCSHEDAIQSLRAYQRPVELLIRAAIANGEVDASIDPVIVLRSFYALLYAVHAPFILNEFAPTHLTSVGEAFAAIFERGVRAHNSATQDAQVPTLRLSRQHGEPA